MAAGHYADGARFSGQSGVAFVVYKDKVCGATVRLAPRAWQRKEVLEKHEVVVKGTPKLGRGEWVGRKWVAKELCMLEWEGGAWERSVAEAEKRTHASAPEVIKGPTGWWYGGPRRGAQLVAHAPRSRASLRVVVPRALVAGGAPRGAPRLMLTRALPWGEALGFPYDDSTGFQRLRGTTAQAPAAKQQRTPGVRKQRGRPKNMRRINAMAKKRGSTGQFV